MCPTERTSNKMIVIDAQMSDFAFVFAVLAMVHVLKKRNEKEEKETEEKKNRETNNNNTRFKED